MPKIVILTGAGISQESGIRTFRASDGLWEDHRIEEVATPEAFARNPALVHRFYNARRAQLFSGEVKENAAHLALARLQRALPGEVTLITQNVDDLHERAGSDVIHMHGELGKLLCLHCDARFETREDCFPETPCPNCGRSGGLRPDIVWFGEMPYHMARIERALRAAEVFVAIGTSGQVYPAAGFMQLAKQAGAKTVEINLEPTGAACDEGHYGKATTEVPRFVEAVLA
ncbi:MAG: NAD-dependent deacylase [Cardiobacteriaceae bacterium]|nr:NAD-dependent deacylase [Cardiobacteriaceae bacterium]